MALNHPSGINLNNYYNANLGYVAPCARNSHVRWYSSCYDVQETIYYFIKFLALPLAASFIFFIIFYLGFYNIPELQLISSILTFIAVLFLTTYIRERVRARIFRIRNGLIDVYDPSNPLMNFTLNNIFQAKFTIGFVGDIMMMRGHDLRFDPEVIDFFKGVDIIVGNLEGIVTPTGGHTLVTQAHCPDILIQLSELLTGNTKWLLCLNNNHSIDFGNIEFHNSLNLINGQGLLVYGRNDAKNVLVNGLGINIATTSRWSNKGTWDCISRHWYINENGGNGISAIHRNINLNLLFTHWSYENERYVRPCVQQEATALLTSANFSWDLIFGHHPHVRQPMMRINDDRTNKNKLVLFSGGNFTSGVRFIRASKHLYGIIMKCKIGPLSSNQNQLAIGDVEWRRTYNRRDVISDRPTKTIIIDRTNEPNPLRYSPIVGIILIIVIIILKILEYFVF